MEDTRRGGAAAGWLPERLRFVIRGGSSLAQIKAALHRRIAVNLTKHTRSTEHSHVKGCEAAVRRKHKHITHSHVV